MCCCKCVETVLLQLVAVAEVLKDEQKREWLVLVKRDKHKILRESVHVSLTLQCLG